jgi:hypothetical protein
MTYKTQENAHGNINEEYQWFKFHKFGGVYE